MATGHDLESDNSEDGSRESYSLDEMMDRLKTGGSGEAGGQGSASDDEVGQIVTRADGSQVVRKRRRKRRSEQPHKKQEALRKKLFVIQIGAGLFFLVLFVFAVLFMFAKYNGGEFSKETEEKISGWVNGEARVEGLSVNYKAAQAKTARLEWADDSFLRKAVFKDLEADLKITNLMFNDWEGEEVLADEGTLSFKKAGKEPKISPSLAFDKTPYRYQRYRCRKTNLLFGPSKSSSPILITQMESSLKDLGTEGFQLTTNSGTMRVKNFGDFDIYRGTFSFRPGMVNIASFRVQDTLGKGEATFSGAMPLTLKDKTSLSLKFEKFPISSVLGEKVARIFNGSIDSEEGKVNFDLGDFNSLVVDVPFKSPDLTMSGFPFLAILAEIVNDANYSKVKFTEKADARIIQSQNDGLRLRDIHFERKGLIVIKGGLHVSKEGSLLGVLRVGIPDARYILAKNTMERSGSQNKLPFSQLDDGYHWVKLDISGTIDSPSDDFADLLRGTIPYSDSTLNPEETFENLTR